MGVMSKAKNLLFQLRSKEMIPIPQPVNAQSLLEGKIALITGGSSGIGFSVAKAFLDSGCKVIIAGTNEEKLRTCAIKLGGIDRKDFVKFIVLDVLDVNAIPDRVRCAAEMFPEKKIDILVNSAGSNGRLNFYDMTEDEYDHIMNVNAKGTYFMSQAVSKLMIEKKTKGHILNVTSASALRPASTPYCVSKWAVRGLTLGLADSLLPYGIIVNAIAPGPVATPMLGKQDGDSIENPNVLCGRFAMPSEIASLAVFMVSDMGNLIVGDTYYITGGSGLISLHH